MARWRPIERKAIFSTVHELSWREFRAKGSNDRKEIRRSDGEEIHRPDGEEIRRPRFRDQGGEFSGSPPWLLISRAANRKICRPDHETYSAVLEIDLENSMPGLRKANFGNYGPPI